MAQQERSRAAAPRCPRCQMLRTLCLCDQIRIVEGSTDVVVVSSKKELRKPTNSARLLTLGLARCEQRIRGDQHRPLDLSDVVAPERDRQLLLLYPAEDSVVLQPRLLDGRPVTLVVPDGNWRQARRVPLRERALDGALRVALPPGAPSRYRLRSHPDPARVSTFEAVLRALAVLEPDLDTQPLDRLFELFVARTLFSRGKLGRDALPEPITGST